MWKCKEWWYIPLRLGITCWRLSQHLLPPPRHQPHLLIPPAQTTNHKKAKNPEIRFNSEQILLYCLGLHTQNPGLREVDLEPSPKRGSDKINMLKWRKSPEENNSHCTTWTDIWIPAHTEAELEPSAKRGANRTKALMSLYRLSWTLHLKELPNQISHKSTKVDPIRLSRTWKESDLISKSSALPHIKPNFPKTTRSTNAHDWGYKWGCHT